MSEEDLQRAEELILELLASPTPPETPREILEQAHERSIPRDAARRVIWRLVSSGKLVFSPDWTVQHVA
jgi:hypothetical protein